MKKRLKKKRNVYLEVDDNDSYDDSATLPGITIHTNPGKIVLQPIKDPHEERRQATRYALELDAILYARGESFKTKTVNISKLGILLAEPVPISFVKQELDIVLIYVSKNSKHHYMMKGRALGAPFRSPRIEITSISAEHKQKYYEILKDARRKGKKIPE